MINISVLTTIYNETFSQIKRAIFSVKNQIQDNIEIEYIIIIDNPIYNDLNKLNDFLDNIEANNFHVKVFVNESNIQLANSLNKGIKLCTSEFIARLDADDWMNEGRLYKQYTVLNEFNSDVVYTDTLLIDEETNTTKYTFSVDGKKIKTLLPLRNVISHSSVMFRKSAIIEVGMYRNLVPAEDYDLWLRINNNNKKFAYINEALTSREIRRGSISNSNIYYQMKMANFVRKLNKTNKTLNVNDMDLNIIKLEKETTKNSRINKFWQEKGLKKILIGISSLFILRIIFNDIKYYVNEFYLKIKYME